MKSDVLDSFKQLARDLTTLEINTIVKDNMTARKMPPPGHAILDIAAFYTDEIQNDLKIALATPFESNESTVEDIPTVGNWEKRRITRAALRCDDFTFQRLRRVAYRILEDRTDLKMDNRVIIQRVMRNSDQIRALLRRLETRHTNSSDSFIGCNRVELIERETKLTRHPGPDLHPDELSLIRKIWDIGVERVVMQSTISLTGDVINRIQRGSEPEEVTAILNFHREGIVSGTRMWKLIADTLVSMTGRFIKFLG